METRANYVLIGAFTLLTAIGLLLFGLWAAKYHLNLDHLLPELQGNRL